MERDGVVLTQWNLSPGSLGDRAADREADPWNAEKLMGKLPFWLILITPDSEQSLITPSAQQIIFHFHNFFRNGHRLVELY
jgi:hypothetical protein